MSEEKKVIRAERRRQVEPAQPEGRERAEVPQRRETGQGSGQPPSLGGVGGSGGTGGSSFPQIPFPFSSGRKLSGRSCIGLVVLLIVVVCILAVMQFLGPQNTGTNETTYYLPTDTVEAFAPVVGDTPQVEVIPTRPIRKKPTATAENAPALPAVATSANLVEVNPVAPIRTAVPKPAVENGKTWLVMLYQDADDKVLEQDIYFDLNEAERVGSSDSVKIVAQLDRYRGGFQGGGDWTTAKRFYVTQDDDLSTIHSKQLADLGEVNMSDGKTLADFVTWAMQTYPADKYALILSDHGMGWPGGWSDSDSHREGDPRIELASRLGDELYLMELDQTLQQIRDVTGLQKFEFIGLDACLMGQIEVLSALEPHARYAVVSEETEPSLGWAYTSFLEGLSKNPSMSGSELSKMVVESYIQDDERIVDDQARSEYLRQGSPMSGMFGMFGDVPAAQLAQQIGQDSTLTAIDLSVVPELMSNLDELSLALQGINQSLVARARSYAQSFTSIFGSQVPPSYIDLGSFIQLLEQEGNDQEVSRAGDNVLAAIDKAVIAEKHGPKKPGATGITIYFPNSQLYKNPVAGPESYTAIASRFAKESLWDDFLAYHYTGLSFEPDTHKVAVPTFGTAIRAPGAGQIQVSPLKPSSPDAAPGKPVLLSADISGQNIGFIYLFVGYYDQAANSIFVADMDYLESSDTRQIQGVYYPVWGDGSEFTLEFEWEPVIFAINDGQKSITALFEPQSYGATFDQAVYTVDGIYTFADSGDTCNARLYFSNGYLTRVTGITGAGETGAPSEITPNQGDTFTLLERWMDLDSSGNVSQVTTQEGTTLTFGDQAFQWKELDAAVGEYIVGFIIEDLDGNANEVYAKVNVR
jgi:hypothetical protein